MGATADSSQSMSKQIDAYLKFSIGGKVLADLLGHPYQLKLPYNHKRVLLHLRPYVYFSRCTQRLILRNNKVFTLWAKMYYF